MKISPMTLENHVSNALDLQTIKQHLTALHERCGRVCHKKGYLMSRMDQVFDLLAQIESELDERYHAEITGSQASTYGRIYYNPGKKKGS